MESVNESQASMSPPSKDETVWAMFCHLSTLLGFVFPFGNIVAPMVKSTAILLVSGL